MLAFGLAVAAAAFAAKKDEPPAREAVPARVYKSAPGQALTKVSAAPAGEVVARFLETKGARAADVASLKTVSEKRSARDGITHVRLEQQVGGLRVEGAYVKAALNANGELIHVIDASARVSGRVSPAAIGEAQALGAALAALHPEQAAPALLVRQGNLAEFDRGSFFHAAPTVERVAIPMKDSSLQTGFLVTTWTVKGNLLDETLVSGSGQVLWSQRRTNSDSYRVFTVDPEKTPQSVQPGQTNWLFGGSHTSTNIAGNNAHAYLDLDANNKVDTGGTTVTSGNFLTVADLTASPTTAGNRNVAVQNLFYLNNVIHDILYTAGFNEADGNFQENNFGLGGKGSDSVLAEAQDGGGTDNANFATPKDGQNPRMQMYLWTGVGTHEAVVNGVTYKAQGAEFGTALTTTGVTGTVAAANDNTAPDAFDGCEAFTVPTGSIALVNRGNCDFTVKVKNAQLSNAAGVIVANNVGETSVFTMGGADASITISAVMVGKNDGAAIRADAGTQGTIRLAATQPLQRDGDVDSDIVYHEYGHGLTWRAIGRMSGAMAGAIGEGMSDVLSVVINDDDRLAEYSASDSFGLRSRPYSGYFAFRTYGDVTGSEVHLDGEVYGAIGWALWQGYKGAGLSRNALLADLVEGMSFTPEQPNFEEMRDGILSAVSGDTGRCNMVWAAFAAGGVGVNATSTVRGSTITVTEDFTPGTCP